MEYSVHGLHRRGRQNFCLQKSRMPLAGLVYLDIYFSMSAMDTFWGIPLRSMHYTEDTAWHQKTLLRVPFECDISKTIHDRHGKVYIKTFRNVSTRKMCECHSSTLDIGGVVAWNQQCSMMSQKGFIFSEPAHIVFSKKYTYLGRIEMAHFLLKYNRFSTFW